MLFITYIVQLHLKEVKMIKLLVSNIDAAASGLRVPGFH